MPNLIPSHSIGHHIDTEHSVSAKTREEALDIFKKAYKRLLNIHLWHRLGGKGTSEFRLIGAHGNQEHRLAQVNDFFKIDIPGPGPKAGNGYDWVVVDAIEDNSNSEGENETFAMRVRPCKDPQSKTDDVAHFFTAEATSTFVIIRNDNTIKAGIYGRSEKPNTDVKNLIDKVRNAAIGAGAIAGGANIQWDQLVKGFLADEVPGCDEG
ncbi:hypothetical protein BH09BAC2_BH09BAC2_21750 [soil metagenome]